MSISRLPIVASVSVPPDGPQFERNPTMKYMLIIYNDESEQMGQLVGG